MKLVKVGKSFCFVLEQADLKKMNVDPSSDFKISLSKGIFSAEVVQEKQTISKAAVKKSLASVSKRYASTLKKLAQ